jgi:cytochrome bd-type quinol oxidase subunit 1
MKSIEKYLFSFYGAALLILSFSIVILFGASGHRLNFRDNLQMLMFGELFIFLLTAIALLAKKRNFIFGRRAMIVLILLTGTALADIFIELRSGEAETVILFLLMLVILMILNVWILIVLLRKRPAERIS